MIYFKVMGEPVGKGRPRFSRRGEYVHAYTPKKTSDYEERMKFEFLASNCEKTPVYGKGIPLKVEMTIAFAIPKSFSKKKQEQARLRLRTPTHLATVAQRAYLLQSYLQKALHCTNR